ncbi:MAG: hypothetical protein U5K38_10395 [Woeseiaceae bacterium]|nr:hypothetical protein [Woeseiaceae bacterium]
MARLRDYKTDDNLLLLQTDMQAGHSGKTGRFRSIEDTTIDYAFLLHLQGIDERANQAPVWPPAAHWRRWQPYSLPRSRPAEESGGIMNFVEYSDRFASSGQPTAAQLTELGQQGYQRVVIRVDGQ